jgi:acyl carrier protein
MDIQSELNKVFQEVFSNPNIQIQKEMTSKDVVGWDSFSHMNLISSIEIHFGIEFTQREVMSLDNVGALINLVERKVDSD